MSEGPAPMRSMPHRTRRSMLVVVLAVVGILAASCGDSNGSTASTTDGGSIPPLTLRAGGSEFDVFAFVYCWRDLCVDGFPEPEDFVVPVGEPIEMRFAPDGWVLQGVEPTDGVWQLDPLAAGSGPVEVTITGRGPEGDGAWVVRLVPDEGDAGAAGASDAEVVAAFAAAVVAGDRASAELVATPNVVDLLAPWDPYPGAVVIDEGNGVFSMTLSPGFDLGCDVGRGQVQACAPIVDEGEVDDEVPDEEFGVGEAVNVTYDRVQFPPGSYGTIVSDAVVRGDRAVYLVDAAAGQSMLVDIQSLENNASFDVWSPTGTPLVIDTTFRAILLPETGDYRVIVGSTRGNASYDLFIDVYRAEVVRFDAGTTGTTVSDAVVRGEQFAYVLGATAGQTLRLSVTSPESNAVFAVYSPSGATLAFEVADADLLLPEDGDYQVVVGSTRGGSPFDLDVSITGN